MTLEQTKQLALEHEEKRHRNRLAQLDNYFRFAEKYGVHEIYSRIVYDGHEYVLTARSLLGGVFMRFKSLDGGGWREFTITFTEHGPKDLHTFMQGLAEFHAENY